MLVEIALKSLALLLVVSLFSVFLRGLPPATRHWVWAVGFMGLMVLPFLRVWLPPREVPSPAFSIAASIAPPPVDRPLRPEAKVQAPPTFAPEPPTPPAFDSGRIAALLWALVSVVLALRTGHLLSSLRGLARRATPVDQPEMRGALDAARRRVGLRRSPALLCSVEIEVPMTFGVVRPVVLLPASAAGWEAPMRDAVMLHECAHVRRRDWAFLVLARLVCAAYWFNPLAWWAERRMRAESEAAADDIVLLTGVSPSRYAEDLLKLADSLRRPNPAQALAVVEAGTLKSRIKGILAKVRRGGVVSRRAASVLGLAGLLIVSAIACTRFASREAPEEQSAPASVLAVEGGNAVTVEAITDMGGEPRSWNMKGELLPQPLTVASNFGTGYPDNLKLGKGPVDRYVVLRVEPQGHVIVQCATASDGPKKPAMGFYTGPYPLPYQSLKGGTFVVCRVGFSEGKTGSMHVWAPSERLRTFAKANFANGTMTSTTNKAFSPKIHSPTDRPGPGLNVAFSLPPELKGQQVSLAVKMRGSTTTGAYQVSTQKAGLQEMEIWVEDPERLATPELRARLESLELRAQKEVHTVLRNIPLEPTPGKVATAASSGLPKMKSVKNGVATLKDGTKLEIHGLIDQGDLEAGGWTYDGKRSASLTADRFRVDEEVTSMPPPIEGRRNLFISLKRKASKKAPGILWLYDHTGRELVEANNVSIFSDDKVFQELRTLAVPKDLKSMGIVVRCSVGDYRLVSKKRFGRDKGVYREYLERGESQGVLKVTFPPDLIKNSWDRDFTFVLRDGKGKPIEDVQGWSGNLEGGYVEFHVTEEKAKLVEAIEFRARDLDLVRFESVALKPK
ncbi:MAG TPA: M56 family metallopeptidase [Fimbriimonas sp.]